MTNALLLTVLAIIVALMIWAGVDAHNKQVQQKEARAARAKKRAEATPEQLAAMNAADALLAASNARANVASQHGPRREAMVCPHCQERGQVHCKAVTNKRGISGGKATGALLTGGVSMLATGLSRKEGATEAWCGNCRSTWQF